MHTLWESNMVIFKNQPNPEISTNMVTSSTNHIGDFPVNFAFVYYIGLPKGSNDSKSPVVSSHEKSNDES